MMKFKNSPVIRMIVFLFVFAFLFGLFIHIFKGQNFLICGSFYYVCLIAFLIYTVKVTEKKSLESIGFDLQGIIKKIIIGIGIFVVLEVVFELYSYVIFKTTSHFVHLSLPQTLLNTVYFICLVGFAEELIFRGYLLERLNETLNSKVYAVLLSSALFALWHYPVSYYFGQVIFTFFFGIILSTIRVKTKGNILISLVIGHGLYNSFIYLAGYFLK